MSLGSGVLFGVLLAYGATLTTANRNNFTVLLGEGWAGARVRVGGREL